jgi:hypothetical protein
VLSTVLGSLPVRQPNFNPPVSKSIDGSCDLHFMERVFQSWIPSISLSTKSRRRYTFAQVIADDKQFAAHNGM